MRFFLTIKHWQFFVCFFILPMVIQILILWWMFSERTFVSTVVGFPSMVLVYMVPFFLWLYALGTCLYKQLPEKSSFNLKMFRILLIVPGVYFLAFTGLVLTMIVTDRNPASISVGYFLIAMVAHLFALMGIFYCFYFVAGALKTIELKRQVIAADFLGEFFLLWFFLIGVWFLQPRINRICQQNAS